MIQLKRAYDAPAPQDGARYLVDRLWPRGVKKEALELTAWAKEVAPSDTLRKWIHADPARWEPFQQRYRQELEAHPEHWSPLLDAARHGPITLLFSAKDPERNNAAVLKAFLEEKLG